METILEIHNLSKEFFLHAQGRAIKSCKNISFTLPKGGFIGIVGYIWRRQVYGAALYLPNLFGYYRQCDV